MGKVTLRLGKSPYLATRVAHCNSFTRNSHIIRKHVALRCQSSRSRQELEAEYYKEWERLTLVPEEELNRKMTFISFIRFIPVWLRYHGLPGPLRFLLFSKKKSDSQSVDDDNTIS